MNEMIQQILDELKGIKEGQDRIEKKLDSVYEHTAKITEDITESNMKIDKISDDMDFIKHKEQQTEQDLVI
ncbi:hypothetical protein [Inediibacterium massiliense]|uniref:hypothetical protein n=1 Tax=Inediibacterium massiliense TaxID=1658111 RepID=UPI0006B567CD|nr:hypothetical protein [Inediibacterium massiliense]